MRIWKYGHHRHRIGGMKYAHDVLFAHEVGAASGGEITSNARGTECAKPYRLGPVAGYPIARHCGHCATQTMPDTMPFSCHRRGFIRESPEPGRHARECVIQADSPAPTTGRYLPSAADIGPHIRVFVGLGSSAKPEKNFVAAAITAHCANAKSILRRP